MDIRIARTDRAIEQAFMELREKNPLEKIKIKDLCAMACINKSTFYAHYEDIYALANALENKLIESILARCGAVLQLANKQQTADCHEPENMNLHISRPALMF